MSLTEIAVRRRRFSIFAAVMLALVGALALLKFPSTEEPSVPVRTATVAAFWPGASTERQENLVAHPLEEHIREIPEVEHLDTVIRSGFTFIYVNLRGGTAPEKLPAIWQRLRTKVADAAGELPDGVSTTVDDEYGRVAVRSLALSGAGYDAGTLQDWAKTIRERLQSVSGVERISLHGVREERIYVEVSPDKLAASGLTLASVAQALAARNVLASPGEIDAQGQTLALEPTGDLPTLTDLAGVRIALPSGGSIALSALGQVVQRPADPPETAVLFDGKPAVVLGISMLPGLNVGDFMSRLDERLTQVKSEIPYGMQLGTVTDQSLVVAKQLGEVGRMFLETVVIVLGVVVFFLGWRSGLVTGAIVPVTVLGTLALMKAFGIELHQVSIAAIIISLGLFVDYAIVVVEDFERRVAEDEDRMSAAMAAGASMAAPLFVSMAAIVLAFVPLVAAQNATAEYMRSLGLVVAITLSLSLFLALTLTPVLGLCGQTREERERFADRQIDRVRNWYRSKIASVLAKPFLAIGAMVGLLAVSVLFYGLLPQQLLSASERAQVQIPISLSPGRSIRETYALAEAVSKALANRALYPELEDNAVYVGDGGPRFILALNPPTPAATKAYAVVNLKPGTDVDDAVKMLKTKLGQQFPGAKFEPKHFSLGPSDAGKAVFRFVGPNRAVLQKAAVRLMAALQREPGVEDVDTSEEERVPNLSVAVDPAKALSAGVTHAGIVEALGAVVSGVSATALRQGNAMVPVIVRGPAQDRLAPERLEHLPVGGTAATVHLGDVARVKLIDRPAVATRRDMFAAVEVTARGHALTAQQIVDSMDRTIAGLGLPDDTHIEYGGEIADSAEANEGLNQFLPLALLGMAGLFLWQFGSLRKTFIVLSAMPFVVIGACLGLWISGQPVSFSATLGLLALAGIIVNNAVLLLARIQYEVDAEKPLHQAIVDAACLRLRPILMTMLTCVMGLIPMFVFGGALWRPLAATMIGGLALGTLITLALVPALYAVLFAKAAPASAPRP